MKKKITKRLVLLAIVLGAAVNVWSQSIGTGRVVARFGVDGDLSSDTSLNGGATSLPIVKPSDDWFYCPNVKNHQGGIGVIDTTGKDSLKLLMQSSSAPAWAFSKGMSVPKLTRSGGYILLDALYSKDYSGNDATVITGPASVKVIDDPSSWVIGSSNLNSKTDVLEFYSHVRRKGATVKDSLFFYFGVGIEKTSGAKNITSELFVNDVQLSGGSLINTGSQGGRVAWRLDGSGNVKVIGDMLINMDYNGSGVFYIEPRIWIRKSTYDSFTQTTGPLAGLRPANFNFGTFYNQINSNPITGFGYADIIPKSTSTNIGEGTANNISTCLAAPWGTRNSSGVYSALYDANQFVEFSANFTAIGVDPSLFSGIDPCTIPYRSIIFYSRTSRAANASPEDFAGPYPFWRYPRVPNILSGGQDLTCTNPSITLTADSAYSLAYYKWTRTPIGGGTEDSVGVGISFNANLPGVYKLKSAPLQGCDEIESQVTIYEDKVTPVATLSTSMTWEQGTGIDTFDILDGDPSFYFVKLYGGNLTASVTAYNALPGVGSAISAVTVDSFMWALTAHDGGLNTVINNTTLVTDIFQGDYYTFTLTGKRNGCLDSQKILITQLPVNILNFDCKSENQTIKLNWKSADEQGLLRYEIQRLEKGQFATIGRINAKENPFLINSYQFLDHNPSQGWNSYRLKMIMQNENAEYSRICMSALNSSTIGNDGISLVPNPAENQVGVVMNTSEENPLITWRVTTATGSKVLAGEVMVSGNAFVLDVTSLPSGVYSLEVINGQRVNSAKLMVSR